MGYGGNPEWSSENGAGSIIYLSNDKNFWLKVGTIPNGFGSVIKSITIAPFIAKYIKFESNYLLGLSYINIEKA